MLRRLPAVAIVLSVAVLLVACGGGSSSPKYDTKRAGDLAHAALLNPGDLPGQGWTTTEDDKFSKPDDIPNTPNCASTIEFNKAAADDIAGQAERRITIPAKTNDTTDLTVQVKVMIYNKTDRLAGVLKQYRGNVTDGSTQKCLLDVIKAELPSNVEISLKQGAAKVQAPEGGVAFAFDVEAKADNDSAQVREEHIVWINGNAVVSLDIQGPPDQVTPDLVKAVVEKTKASLENAAKQKAK